MSKTLLGFVTYGNKMFTEKMLESITSTTMHKMDAFGIVGKPGDVNTEILLNSLGIPYLVHNENKGFPASVNDIYDYAFKEHDYDNVIIAGNDIIAYPYAIDNLIFTADTSDFDAISTMEVNVRDIVAAYPELSQYFIGSNFVINNLNSNVWKRYTGYSKNIEITDPKGIIDIHNLCIYKRSVFEKVGYIDVNFYPAYFEDNDYVRRIGFTDLKTITINGKYFHFWSRTIHQETGGSNGHYFDNNRKYYIAKWGGVPNSEIYSQPFNSSPYALTTDLYAPMEINIQTRDLEPHFINYWKNK